MNTRRIATSSRKDFEVLRYQGIAASDGYAQISAIATSLGPEHALLFAEPAYDITGASTDWYTAAEGDIRPFADLSPEEQKRTRSRVAELADDIGELAEQLKNSQAGSKVIRGNVLALALRFPDASHIYLVGSQPVLTCWGTVAAHAENVPASGLSLESAPPVRTEPALELAPEPPAPKKSRTGLNVLLFFFFFLLLLAMLFFGAVMLFAPKEYAPEYLREYMPDWFTRWTPEDVQKYVPESLKKYLPDGSTGETPKAPESAEAPTSPEAPAGPLDDGNKEDDPQRELERLTRRLLQRAKTGDGEEPAPSVQTPPTENPRPTPMMLAPGERPPKPTPVVVPTPYADPEGPKLTVPSPAEVPIQPAPVVPAPVETPAQPTPTVPAPAETPPQPAPAVPGQPAPMLPVPTETPEKPAPVVPESAKTPSPPVPPASPPAEVPAKPAPVVPAPTKEPAKPSLMLRVPIPTMPLRPEPSTAEPPSIGDMLPTTPDPPPGTLPPDPTPTPKPTPLSSVDKALFPIKAGVKSCSGVVAGRHPSDAVTRMLSAGRLAAPHHIRQLHVEIASAEKLCNKTHRASQSRNAPA